MQILCFIWRCLLFHIYTLKIKIYLTVSRSHSLHSIKHFFFIIEKIIMHLTINGICSQCNKGYKYWNTGYNFRDRHARWCWRLEFGMKNAPFPPKGSCPYYSYIRHLLPLISCSSFWLIFPKQNQPEIKRRRDVIRQDWKLLGLNTFKQTQFPLFFQQAVPQFPLIC